MPGCCVIGCSNRSEQGYRMFLIPQGDRNEARRTQWIVNVGRLDLPLKSVVCEAHFTSDQFENRRKDNKRFLRWNAVPTIFNSNNPNNFSRKRKIVSLKNQRLVKQKEVTVSDDQDKTDCNDQPNRKSLVHNLTKGNGNGCLELKRKGTECNRNFENIEDDDGFIKNNCGMRRSQRKIKSNVLNDYYYDYDDGTVGSYEIRNDDSSSICCGQDEKEELVEPIPKRYNKIIIMPARGQESEIKPTKTSKNLVAAIDKICRICGHFSEILSPIFGKALKKKNLPLFINQYLPIEVNEAKENNETGRLLNVCDNCIKQIVDWAQLFDNCKKANEIFVNLSNYKETTLDGHNSIQQQKQQNNDVDGTIMNATRNDHNYCPNKKYEKPTERVDDALLMMKSLYKKSDADGFENDCDDLNKSDGATDVSSSNYPVKNSDSNMTAITMCDEKYYMKRNRSLDTSSNSNDSEIALSSNHTVNNDDRNGARVEETPREYKIGITLVKKSSHTPGEDKCNKVGLDRDNDELNFNTLKHLFIEKLDSLYKSICSDKKINRHLIDSHHDSTNELIEHKGKYVSKIPDGIDVNHDNDDDDDEFNDNNIISEQEYASGDVTFNENDRQTSLSSDKTNLEFCSNIKKINQVGQLITSKIINRCVLKKSYSMRNDGPYLCSDCGHFLKKRKSYQQHRRVHHTEKKCDYCYVILPSYFDYRRHVRGSHNDIISKISCDLCDAKFIKNERLQRHKLVIHNVGEYFYCDVCGKKCASKQQLHCHKSDKHHRDDGNICPYCGEKFISRNSFVSHIRSKHANATEKSHMCMICHKQLTTLNSLIIHTARHANNYNGTHDVDMVGPILDEMLHKQMYSCLVCNIKVTHVDMLKQHMSYHSNDDFVCSKTLLGVDSEMKMLLCHLCDKYFDKEKELALHRFYVHNEIPFICLKKDCDSSFWSKLRLVVHEISVHKSCHRSSISCEICSKKFANRKQKQRHLKIHHSKTNTDSDHALLIKKFTCNYCDKKFTSEGTLKMHTVVHSNNKNYCCHLCGRAFKLKLTLSKHLRFHFKNNMRRNPSTSRDANEQEKEKVAVLVMKNSPTVLAKDKRKCSLPEEDINGADNQDGVSVSVDDMEMAIEEGDGVNVFKYCTMFKCPICTVLFVSKQALDQHLFQFHQTATNDRQSSSTSLIPFQQLNIDDMYA